METKNIQLHDNVRIVGYNEFYNWSGPVMDITEALVGDEMKTVYGLQFNEYDDDYWYFEASELEVQND